MASPPSLTQSAAQAAVRAFLLSILPTGVDVIEAQDNRVPEPEASDFVVMSVLGRSRLGTGYNAWADVAFHGSTSGNVLTVSSMVTGTILLGSTLFTTTTAWAPAIVKQLTGTTGGAGTYQLSSTGAVAASLMACGNIIITQPTQIDLQLDVHAEDAPGQSLSAVSRAADMTQTIMTAFNTSYSGDAMTAVTPLYAGDPKQLGFTNSEQQVENRWTIDVSVQANIAIDQPMQFFTAVLVTIVVVK